MDVQVYGAQDIARMAAEVRRLGNGRTIPNNMAKRIRRAAPPIRKAIKASAVSTLPKGGGLNRWVADAGVRVSVKRGARSAGVSLVGSRKSLRGRTDLRRMNAGQTRSPSWGRRAKGQWHTHVVPPGYFDKGAKGDGFNAFANEANEAIGDAIREVFG